MGLISIKNCLIETKWGQKDGYRLSFVSAGDPNCLVFHTVTASLDERSSLVRTLRNMLDIGSAEMTNTEAFERLLSCLDGWFEVRILHKRGMDREGKEKIWARVDSCDIRPLRDPAQCPPRGAREHMKLMRAGLVDTVVDSPMKVVSVPPVKATSFEEDEIPF